MNNPWKLTEAQANILGLLAKVGCDKLAARQLGVSSRTVETHVRNARKRMGIATRVVAVVVWDRWQNRRKA